MVKSFNQEWDVMYDIVKSRSQNETIRTEVKNQEKLYLRMILLSECQDPI